MLVTKQVVEPHFSSNDEFFAALEGHQLGAHQLAGGIGNPTCSFEFLNESGVESGDLGLRVFVGRKQAVVSATDRGRDTLRELVERAVAMATLAPEDEFCGLAFPSAPTKREAQATSPRSRSERSDAEAVLGGQPRRCPDAFERTGGPTTAQVTPMRSGKANICQ